MPKASKITPPDDPRYVAAVDLIGRTGAKTFKIGYCDEEAPPVIWYVCALYGDHWEVTGGQGPLLALFRMLESLIDGGVCMHCKKPTGFEESAEPVPLDNLVCWYQWDPSTKTYARGCAK
jgi:hypothetical protein